MGMIQTTKKGHVLYPDGCKVEVKSADDSSFFDLGVLSGDVTSSLDWEEKKFETANGGELDTRVTNMTIAGSMTLINLDPEGVARLSGGLLKVTEVEATPVTPSSQSISGAVANTVYPLVLKSSGAVIRTVDAPVIASLTIGGTASTDYVVAQVSGEWSIIFGEISDAEDVVITYGSNTPIAKTVVSCGTSSLVLKPFALRISHTDENDKVRAVELYSVSGNSGGFQFNFKAANSDGVEEMPFSYTAKLDTSRVNGEQLMTWSIDEGAM